MQEENQIATGPPILSFGPMPFRRTAIRPMMRPRPARPVEHQRPVEYCWAMLCPFSMSTASVVAAEMASATPEPIWKAVLSCIKISDPSQIPEETETYHSTTETLDVDRNTGQDCCAGRDEDEGNSCDADQ